MDEVKPCPFCGGRAEVDARSSRGPHGEEFPWWHVVCLSCCATGPRVVRHYHGDAYAIGEAVRAWNARR